MWYGFLGNFPRVDGRTASTGWSTRRSARSLGYMLGNFLTSVIAGIVVFVSLTILGVPFAGLLGIFVALVDLLPLVGGLLAGLPVVIMSAIHSVRRASSCW